MKFKNTYVLILIAALLGGYIYFFEFKKTEQDQELKEKNEKVINIESDKVRKLIFKNTFGDLVVEKDAENVWQLLKPSSDLADDGAILNMISALNAEKYEQVVQEGDGDLKPYGLDQPKMTLEIYLGSGETKKILIGNDAAIMGKLYAMVEGSKKVLFCNQGLKFQIDKGVRDLRDKRIFRKSRDDVRFIKIQNFKSHGDIIELEKNDKGWQIVKPISEPADQETVLAYINAIDALRATDFPSEKSDDSKERSKFDLNKPELLISLSDKDKKQMDELTIGPKKQNNVFVINKNSKTIYQVFTAASEQLTKSTQDFRDKKSAFDFNRDEVKYISIKTDLVNFNFSKRNEVWELAPHDSKKEVNQLQIANLINKISELRISESLQKPLMKPNKPVGSVVLQNEKKETLLEILWIDKISSKSVGVWTNKSGKVVGVDAALIKALPGQTLVEDKAESKAGTKEEAEAKIVNAIKKPEAKK